MTAVSTPTSGLRKIGLWALRIAVAGLFLFAGYMKLTGQPMMVQEFETVGLGQWFRYATGVIEVIGAIMVLIPTVSALGGCLLLLVDVGAFVAQVAVIHMDWIHTIAIGIVIGLLIYLQRRQLRDLRSSGSPP
jgi:putative oxidoreductase